MIPSSIPPPLPPLPKKKNVENFFDSLSPQQASSISHVSVNTQFPKTMSEPSNFFDTFTKTKSDQLIENEPSTEQLQSIFQKLKSKLDEEQVVRDKDPEYHSVEQDAASFYSNCSVSTPVIPSATPEFTSPLEEFKKFYSLGVKSDDSLRSTPSPSESYDVESENTFYHEDYHSEPEKFIDKTISMVAAQDLPNLPVRLQVKDLPFPNLDQILAEWNITKWKFYGSFDFGSHIYLFDSFLLIHLITSFQLVRYEHCTIQLYGTPTSAYSLHIYDSITNSEHVVKSPTANPLMLIELTKNINIFMNSFSDKNRVFLERVKVDVISNNQIALQEVKEVDPFLSPGNLIIASLKEQSFEIEDPYVSSISIFEEFNYKGHMYHLLGGNNGLFMKEIISMNTNIPWKKTIFVGISKLIIYKNVMLLLTVERKLSLTPLENAVDVYNGETRVAELYDLVELETIYHIELINSFIYVSCRNHGGVNQLIQLQEESFPSDFPMLRIRRQLPVKTPIHKFSQLESGSLLLGLTEAGFIEINLEKCTFSTFPDFVGHKNTMRQVTGIYESVNSVSNRRAILFTKIFDSFYLLIFSKCAVLLNKYYQPIETHMLEFDFILAEAYHDSNSQTITLVSDSCFQIWSLNMKENENGYEILWQKEYTYVAKNMKLLKKDKGLVLRFNHPYFTREMRESELEASNYTPIYEKSMPQLIVKLNLS